MAPSSTLQAAAAEYLEALATLSQEKITAVLSDKYQHTVAPSTLAKEFGLPTDPISGEAFIAGAAAQKALYSDYSLKIKEAWPNEADNVITVWAAAEAHLSEFLIKAGDDTPRIVHREYMFVLTIDANNKVERALEFLDTASVKHVLGLAQALKEQK